MKPACQHCKKFFHNKHGRNIHEHWCPSNPTNAKHGAPTTPYIKAVEKEEQVKPAKKLKASKPELNYCPNCSFEVRNLRAFDKAGPNYCPNCGVHLDNIDLY